MKEKGVRGLSALLIAVLVALLSGCVGQKRFTYVLYDSDGCAFFVERTVSEDDAGSLNKVATQAPPYKPVQRGWWKGDTQYPGQIQRLSHDDQPTCKLPKE